MSVVVQDIEILKVLLRRYPKAYVLGVRRRVSKENFVGSLAGRGCEIVEALKRFETYLEHQENQCWYAEHCTEIFDNDGPPEAIRFWLQKNLQFRDQTFGASLHDDE